MAKGMRRKYEVQVASPLGLNLLDEDEVNRYIQAQIIDRVRFCITDFVDKESEVPQVVRLPGEMYAHFKKALTKHLKKGYLEDKEVYLDGIRVEASCKYTGVTVAVEFWDDEDD